jgi:hypothetical protein
MDDRSVVPQAPELIPQPFEPVVDEVLLEEKRLASAAIHPAWEAVQQEIETKIDQYRDISAVDANLLAHEFKVEALVRARVAIEFANLLDRIRHAVEATERSGSQ